MNTRSQRYAELIYQQMQKVSVSDRKAYRFAADALPALIYTAGLAKALSFVACRNEKGSNQLLADLGVIVAPGNDLLRLSRCADLRTYMVLTRQVQQALVWYKRFAQSLWDVEVTDKNEAGAETATMGETT